MEIGMKGAGGCGGLDVWGDDDRGGDDDRVGL